MKKYFTALTFILLFLSCYSISNGLDSFEDRVGFKGSVRNDSFQLDNTDLSYKPLHLKGKLSKFPELKDCNHEERVDILKNISKIYIEELYRSERTFELVDIYTYDGSESVSLEYKQVSDKFIFDYNIGTLSVAYNPQKKQFTINDCSIGEDFTDNITMLSQQQSLDRYFELCRKLDNYNEESINDLSIKLFITASIKSSQDSYSSEEYTSPLYWYISGRKHVLVNSFTGKYGLIRYSMNDRCFDKKYVNEKVIKDEYKQSIAFKGIFKIAISNSYRRFLGNFDDIAIPDNNDQAKWLEVFNLIKDRIFLSNSKTFLKQHRSNLNNDNPSIVYKQYVNNIKTDSYLSIKYNPKYQCIEIEDFTKEVSADTTLAKEQLAGKLAEIVSFVNDNFEYFEHDSSVEANYENLFLSHRIYLDMLGNEKNGFAWTYIQKRVRLYFNSQTGQLVDISYFVN